MKDALSAAKEENENLRSKEHHKDSEVMLSFISKMYFQFVCF